MNKRKKNESIFIVEYVRPSKSAHMHTTHMVSVTANCHSSSKTHNPTFENLNVYTISRTATKITNVFYEQDGDDEHEMKIDFFSSFVRFSVFLCSQCFSHIFVVCKIKKKTAKEKKNKTKQFK